jgi:hypothetical protein
LDLLAPLSPIHLPHQVVPLPLVYLFARPRPTLNVHHHHQLQSYLALDYKKEVIMFSSLGLSKKKTTDLVPQTAAALQVLSQPTSKAAEKVSSKQRR